MKTQKEQIIFDVIGLNTEYYDDFRNFAIDKTELNKIMDLVYTQAFHEGIEFAERWISVDEEMPEHNEYFIEPREDEFEAEKTIKVLVMTEQGDITDNRRLKMAVGKKEWVWFMGYEGDARIIKWRPIERQ